MTKPLSRVLNSLEQYNAIRSNSDQITMRGNLITNVRWNRSLLCQEGIAVLPDGSTRRAWRGGYEPWGEGWILL